METGNDLESGPILSALDTGTGAPVLLLHGIPGSRKTWRRVIPLLGHARVVVPDLLGFGESPDVARDGHAVEQAAAVHQLMLRRNAAPAHVVGFDFGGPVAIELHRRDPSLLRSLTLIATNLVTDNPVPLPLRAARVPLLGPLLFAALCSRPGLAMMHRGATADRAAFPREEFAPFRNDARGRRTTRRIFLDSIRDLQKLYAPIEATLPEIRLPVTILWGDHDPFFDVAAGRRTAGRIPSARFEIAAGCGHFLPHECPEMVAASVRRALHAAEFDEGRARQ